MKSEWDGMWEGLGLNLDQHCTLLTALKEIYPELYVKQNHRPAGMDYFDFVISEVHGLRIKELLDHKAKGNKVIGTFCLYVPEEVVVALDALCIGLCAGADFSIPFAETELPRNLCPLIKSFYGFKVGRVCPYFESSDLVVGETTCDGKKKVYEVLADKNPLYVMEVTNKKGPEDRALWKAELNKFIAKVEETTGKKLTADNLRAAIKKINDKRRALRRLNELRYHDPAPISGKDALLAMQVSFYDDVDRFTASVNKIADELEGRVKKGEGVAPKGAPRVVVSGTPMAIPNWKIHHLIETSGAVAVAEEMCTGYRYFKNLVKEDGKTLEDLKEALVDHYMDINCACFTPNDGRLDDIKTLYDRSKAHGVVHATLSFCTPYLVEYNRVKKFADENKILVLPIESDYSMGDMGQLKTRIEAFVEQIKKK